VYVHYFGGWNTQKIKDEKELEINAIQKLMDEHNYSNNEALD